MLAGVHDVRFVVAPGVPGFEARLGGLFRALEGLEQTGNLSRPMEDLFDFINPF